MVGRSARRFERWRLRVRNSILRVTRHEISVEVLAARIRILGRTAGAAK